MFVQHKSHNAELRKTNSVSVNKKSAQCAEHREPKLNHEVNLSLVHYSFEELVEVQRQPELAAMMRYSEISRDLSTDNLRYSEVTIYIFFPLDCSSILKISRYFS